MPLTRSQQMARIRGRHTGAERTLRSLLWREGLRYRLHARTPVGRPDLVFAGPRVAVFIDGCFWHGCPEHYVRPRSSASFWAAKLVENVERDIRQTRALEEQGWRVCRVWEHEVFARPAETVARVVRAVRSRSWRPVESWRVFRVVEVDQATQRERRRMKELRHPERKRTVVRKRSTAKWTRAQGAATAARRSSGAARR